MNNKVWDLTHLYKNNDEFNIDLKLEQLIRFMKRRDYEQFSKEFKGFGWQIYTKIHS